MKALDSGSDSDRKRSRSQVRSRRSSERATRSRSGACPGQSKWSKAKIRRVRDDTYEPDMDDASARSA